MSFIDKYFDEVSLIIKKIDRSQIERMINVLITVRKNKGR